MVYDALRRVMGCVFLVLAVQSKYIILNPPNFCKVNLKISFNSLFGVLNSETRTCHEFGFMFMKTNYKDSIFRIFKSSL